MDESARGGDQVIKKGPHWRADLALLCIAAMEITWFTPWGVLLSGSGSDPIHRVPWFAWLGLFLLALYLARGLSASRAPVGMQVAVAVLLAMGASVALVALYGYAHYPDDPRVWLRTWLEHLVRLRASGLWGMALPLLASTCVARGALMAHRRVAARDVRASLLEGGVAWLLYAIAAMLFHLSPVAPVWGFAFVSLAILGSGMARLEEASRARVASRAAASGYWSALVAACTGVLIGAGLLMASIPSWLSGGALIRAIGRLLHLFRLAVAWFVNLLEKLFGRLVAPPPPTPIPRPGWVSIPTPTPAPSADVLPPWLVAVGNVLLGAVLVALAVFIVLTWARRRRRDEEPAGPAPSEWDIGPVDGQRGLRGTVRRRLEQMRGGRARAPRPQAQLATVRQIYGSVLRLAEWRGTPRHEKETPYEYQRRLDGARPQVQAPLGEITEAYVRARYGGVELTDAEVERLRVEWEQVRVKMEE